MPQGNIEEYKESISDKYIKDFKKGLRRFEKVMIFPIEKKMKEILKSNKKIDVSNLKDLEDLWFWRKVLGVKVWEKQLFESLMTKTFNFLKEKQEKIIQAQTEWRLDELSALVINGKLDILEQRVNTQDPWENLGEDNPDLQNEEPWDNPNWEEEDDWDNPWNNIWDQDNPDSDPWDNHVNSIAVGTAVGVWWSATYLGWLAVAERRLWTNVLRNVPEEFDGKHTREMMRKMGNMMQERLDAGIASWNMSKITQKTYSKSIEEFTKAANSLDAETEAGFRAWQKMGSRMPHDFLKNMHVDRKTLNLLDGLVDRLPKPELTNLLNDTPAGIVKKLGDEWITVSEDFAKTMKIAKNAWELKQITRMAKCGTRLSNVLKWIKWMWVLTFLMLWFDFWVYFEGKKESELVAKVNEARGQVLKDKAGVQLQIWIASVLVEAAAIFTVCVCGGSVWGPWWIVIWAAVWVLAATASILYDSLYADVKEFYAQNRYDFVNQSRAKVKQSIVQLLESNRCDLDEWMKESVRELRWPNSDANTLEDACESLILHEECASWWFYMMWEYYHSGESEENFLKKKADELKKLYEEGTGESLQKKIDEMKAEYKEEKEKLEWIIKIRMDYVKKFINEDQNSSEYLLMKKKLESNQWMEYIEQILADSKVYATIQKDMEDPYVENYKNLGVDEYKEAYKDKLKADYPREFEIFDNLSKNDPYLLNEICSWSKALRQEINQSMESAQEAYSKDELKNINKNLDFVEKFDEYYNLGRPIEKRLSAVEWMYNNIDKNYIEQILSDNFTSINKRSSWDRNQTLDYMYSDYYRERLEAKYDVSDSLSQNILYSIAVECHWYSGKNDLFDLIMFYNEWDKKNLWIYYDERRRFSNDYWHDWEVTTDITKLDGMSPSELEHVFTHWDLDSPIGAADDRLSIEYWRRAKEIIIREVKYRQNKAQYEQKIVDFIKANASADSYVELPYWLMIESKKAWIGPIEHYVFKIENGVIVAMSCGDSADEVLHFDSVWQQIKYESTTPLRETLTKQEADLIKSVDIVCGKLAKMRGVEMDELDNYKHTDELDIPIQLERIISKKMQDWKKEKDMIYYMTPYMAQQYLLTKAKEYYDYFDWLYRGLLTTITSFKNANDINDINDFYRSMTWTDQFDILTVKKEWWYTFNTEVPETISKILPELFEYYKDEVTWKTVKELLTSTDEDNEDKEKAKWQFLARQIYTICMEESVLHYRNWELDDFYVDWDDDLDINHLKTILNDRMKEFSFFDTYEAESSYDIDVDSIQLKEQWIRQVTKAEKNLHNEIGLATEKIINTMEMVDWTWFRWDPTFEANVDQNENGVVTWVLKTWWYSEPITIVMENWWEIKSIKIDWLDMEFKNVEEWFRVANLINWIKKNKQDNPKWKGATGYMWGKYADYIWNWGALERNVTGWLDNITILKVATANKYPSINGNKKFIDYINSDKV